MLYTVDERIARSSPRVRRAFDVILARLTLDPEIDQLAIFDDFVSPNAALRLYLDKTFLVTFAVRGKRVLVIDFVHTSTD